jgi:hypothetical protein
MDFGPPTVQQLAQPQRRHAEHEDRCSKLRILALRQQETELLDAQEAVTPGRFAELMDSADRIGVVSAVPDPSLKIELRIVR